MVMSLEFMTGSLVEEIRINNLEIYLLILLKTGVA